MTAKNPQSASASEEIAPDRSPLTGTVPTYNLVGEWESYTSYWYFIKLQEEKDNIWKGWERHTMYITKIGNAPQKIEERRWGGGYNMLILREKIK